MDEQLEGSDDVQTKRPAKWRNIQHCERCRDTDVETLVYPVPSKTGPQCLLQTQVSAFHTASPFTIRSLCTPNAEYNNNMASLVTSNANVHVCVCACVHACVCVYENVNVFLCFCRTRSRSPMSSSSSLQWQRWWRVSTFSLVERSLEREGEVNNGQKEGKEGENPASWADSDKECSLVIFVLMGIPLLLEVLTSPLQMHLEEELPVFLTGQQEIHIVTKRTDRQTVAWQDLHMKIMSINKKKTTAYLQH